MGRRSACCVPSSPGPVILALSSPRLLPPPLPSSLREVCADPSLQLPGRPQRPRPASQRPPGAPGCGSECGGREGTPSLGRGWREEQRGLPFSSQGAGASNQDPPVLPLHPLQAQHSRGGGQAGDGQVTRKPALPPCAVNGRIPSLVWGPSWWPAAARATVRRPDGVGLPVRPGERKQRGGGGAGGPKRAGPPRTGATGTPTSGLLGLLWTLPATAGPGQCRPCSREATAACPPGSPPVRWPRPWEDSGRPCPSRIPEEAEPPALGLFVWGSGRSGSWVWAPRGARAGFVQKPLLEDRARHARRQPLGRQHPQTVAQTAVRSPSCPRRERWCHMTQEERDDSLRFNENITFGQLG